MRFQRSRKNPRGSESQKGESLQLKGELKKLKGGQDRGRCVTTSALQEAPNGRRQVSGEGINRKRIRHLKLDLATLHNHGRHRSRAKHRQTEKKTSSGDGDNHRKSMKVSINVQKRTG